jgi:hypothetical protein
MRPTIFLPTLAIAAAAACSSAVAPGRDAASLDASEQSSSGARTDTTSVRLGSTATFDGGRLELTFDARVADSRCPANVVCVWAGDAHARIKTRVAGGAVAASELHSTLEPLKLKIDRYTISMVGMTPYPGTGRDAETPVLIVRVSSE